MRGELPSRATSRAARPLGYPLIRGPRVSAHLHSILHAQRQDREQVQPNCRFNGVDARTVTTPRGIQTVIIGRVDGNHAGATADAAYVVAAYRQYHDHLPAVGGHRDFAAGNRGLVAQAARAAPAVAATDNCRARCRRAPACGSNPPGCPTSAGCCWVLEASCCSSRTWPSYQLPWLCGRRWGSCGHGQSRNRNSPTSLPGTNRWAGRYRPGSHLAWARCRGRRGPGVSSPRWACQRPGYSPRRTVVLATGSWSASSC